ncbi:LysR family transcriptional regulator [Amorphus orientalis]|uniref:DNA-binding transcriptional LysR family regulator n=1 Tax=Amorphus orientalis TaxID=649198 RepID=A0AAE3VSN2_9HYPH|nr:LysR family transcriptional regulator [Amorphus orientalis]MDQ0317627.1 DNA-binding transcriptional LysR family regulator [Amorphus orientalis]
MRITLKQIDAFLAVAESGSFSRAATRTKAAQPALSQAVKELEAELGTRLFDRTTRRVELTEAGRDFRVAVEKVVEDLDLAVQNVHALAERRRGRIRIAAPPLLAAAVLPQAIAEFRRDFPGISVDLIDASTDEIIESVRSGRADCGLGTFPPGGDQIERLALARDQLMLFCHESSALNAPGPLAWADLAGTPLVSMARTSAIRLLTEVGFETAGIELAPSYEVNQITTAMALVEAGLGAAVLPTYAYAAVRNGTVVGRRLAEPDIAREIHLIHANGRTVSPAVAAFTPVLRRTVQSLSPARSGTDDG